MTLRIAVSLAQAEKIVPVESQAEVFTYDSDVEPGSGVELASDVGLGSGVELASDVGLGSASGVGPGSGVELASDVGLGSGVELASGGVVCVTSNAIASRMACTAISGTSATSNAREEFFTAYMRVAPERATH